MALDPFIQIKQKSSPTSGREYSPMHGKDTTARSSLMDRRDPGSLTQSSGEWPPAPVRVRMSVIVCTSLFVFCLFVFCLFIHMILFACPPFICVLLCWFD